MLFDDGRGEVGIIDQREQIRLREGPAQRFQDSFSTTLAYDPMVDDGHPGCADDLGTWRIHTRVPTSRISEIA